LVSVTVCAALVVPSAWLENVKVAGLVDTATIPVPLMFTFALVLELLEMVRVPALLPACVGVKKTDIVHVALAPRVFGLSGHVVVVV
jgi:hypothetical protein